MSEDELSLADSLLRDLFPIRRSLSGDGNRETLRILGRQVPLAIEEIPSGTRCFDWEIPPEWRVREAWIRCPDGRKVADLEVNNLHLVGYSVPIHRRLTLDQLRPHLHTLEHRPRWIPYRTSYYKRSWGFCLDWETYSSLDEGEYEVLIDSDLDAQGSLTLASCLQEGTSGQEFLISTYCCHPSMANDNLSGLVLAILLFRRLSRSRTRHSYRLVIAPETIGVIAYLWKHLKSMQRVEGGYVVTTVAGPGRLGYKESFLGEHVVDRAARYALRDTDFVDYPFEPTGSDERQYSSPGIRIPTGTISKDKYYEYPEYHTSADNLDFATAENLGLTLEVYWDAIQALEKDRVFRRSQPSCEYQLSRYGLYPELGGIQHQPAHLGSAQHGLTDYEPEKDSRSTGEFIDALCWVMFAADGETSLLQVAERSGVELEELNLAADRLLRRGLLEEV